MLVIWNGPDPRQHSSADQGKSNDRAAQCPDVLGKWGLYACWLPGKPAVTRVKAMGHSALSGHDAGERVGPWWVKTTQLPRVSLHQYLAGKVPHKCLMKWQLGTYMEIRFSFCHHSFKCNPYNFIFLSLQWHPNEGNGVFKSPKNSIVYSAICSDTNQRKLQSSASLAFVRGIHWWPVNTPHKGEYVSIWWCLQVSHHNWVTLTWLTAKSRSNLFFAIMASKIKIKSLNMVYRWPAVCFST